MLRQLLALFIIALGGSLSATAVSAAAPFSGSQAQDQEAIEALVRGLGAPRIEDRAEGEARLMEALGARAAASRLSHETVALALSEVLGSSTPSVAVRRRLSVLLGSDSRFFGWAAELAADGRSVPRAVGEAALVAQLERWSRTVMAEPSVAAYDIPRQALPLPKALTNMAASRVALDPNGSVPATPGASIVSGATAFDLLDRRGGAPLPIVLDPSFVERLARRPASRLGASRIDGRWPDVLDQLCAIHDGAYQLQGYRFPDEVDPFGTDEAAPPARAWIHVVQRGTTQLAPVGRDLRELGGDRVVMWCTSVLREGNLLRQAAAARALAALGIPAAIEWLERRWSWYGDTSALEGLMAAAARGRVAPTLQTPVAIRSILESVERSATELVPLREARRVALADETKSATGLTYREAAGALDARLRRIALGLREIIPVLVDPSRPEGVVSLASVLFSDFDGATREGRWLRLAVAEGLGKRSSEVAAAAVAVLGDPRTADAGGPGGPLRRQALRTLGVARGPWGPTNGSPPGGVDAPVKLARVEELFSIRGQDARDLAGLGSELGRVGATVLVRSAGFPSVELLEYRPALTELLVWCGLSARLTGDVPPWAPRVLEAAAQEWLAARAPDLRDTERAALTVAARRLSAIDGALSALLERAVGPLDRADRIVVESVVLRQGGLSAERRREAFQRAEEDLERRASDPAAVQRAWLDLAALVGDEGLGGPAQRALLESITAALAGGSGAPAGTSTELIFAVERALAALRAARLDTDAQAFRRALREAAQAADHPLGQRFRDAEWPPTPRSGVRDLERAEPVRPPLYLFS